jgi:hypothetical protein
LHDSQCLEAAKYDHFVPLDSQPTMTMLARASSNLRLLKYSEMPYYVIMVVIIDNLCDGVRDLSI